MLAMPHCPTSPLQHLIQHCCTATTTARPGMGQPWDGMMNGFAHGTIQPEGCRPKEQHLLHPPRAAQPQHCKLAIKLTALAFEYPKC